MHKTEDTLNLCPESAPQLEISVITNLPFPTTHSACSSIVGWVPEWLQTTFTHFACTSIRNCAEYSSKQLTVLATLPQQLWLLPQPHSRYQQQQQAVLGNTAQQLWPLSATCSTLHDCTPVHTGARQTLSRAIFRTYRVFWQRLAAQL